MTSTGQAIKTQQLPRFQKCFHSFIDQTLFSAYYVPGFPGGSDGKESVCNAGDLGSIPEAEHGNPLQYSFLENPHGQRNLAGYSPWSHKELDMIERLSTQHSVLPRNYPYNVGHITISLFQMFPLTLLLIVISFGKRNTMSDLPLWKF